MNYFGDPCADPGTPAPKFQSYCVAGHLPPGRLNLHCSPQGMSWDFLPWRWWGAVSPEYGALGVHGCFADDTERGWSELGSGIPVFFCIRFGFAVPRCGGAPSRARDNGRLMGRPSRLQRPRESGDPGPAGLALGEGAAGKGGAVWVG